MRRRCSSSEIYTRIEPGVPMAPPPVIIGLIPDHYAVWSTDGESAAVVVVGNVVTDYRIRRPHFESTHRPPSSSLRGIKTGASPATNVADYCRRVRARQSLYKNTTARSRPVYMLASDKAVAPGERNSSALANIVDDAPMAGPDPGVRGNKDCTNWWPCSGHRSGNTVPFDRPFATAERGDSPFPASNHRAVCRSPVVTSATDGRESDSWRGVVAHVERQVFHAPVVSLAWQKIIRRHPGDLEDGRPALRALEMNARQNGWLVASRRDTGRRNEICSLWNQTSSAVHRTCRQSLIEGCRVVRYTVAHSAIGFNVNYLATFIWGWASDLLARVLAVATPQLQRRRNACRGNDEQ